MTNANSRHEDIASALLAACEAHALEATIPAGWADDLPQTARPGAMSPLGLPVSVLAAFDSERAIACLPLSRVLEMACAA